MTLDPQVAAFLKSLEKKSGPKSHEVTPEVARKARSTMQAIPVDMPAVDAHDRTLPGGPTGEIPVRIVRPRGAIGELPAVMYFHGGGWVVGDKETHFRIVCEIAAGVGATVVYVDYTRSPEARYPVAIEQAYAATQWVAQNGRQIGIDPTRLALFGDSSGGNMAAVVALMAKQRSGPALRAQVLACPVVNDDFETGSYHDFADGFFMSRELMKWFWNHYAPDVQARKEITASPLRATVDQLRGLPPTLMITATNDVLRDEGEAYAAKLMEAGVEVTATRYIGTIHAFIMLNPIAQTPATRAAVGQTNEFLKRKLAR